MALDGTALAAAPVADQLAAFEGVLRSDVVVMAVLERLPQLGVPDCWLTAGALFQAVWNAVSGRPTGDGVRDYDIGYFDGTDLTWDAEDAVIRWGARVFAGLGVEVEIRNEARVHLWYEQKFGVPCPPYRSTCDAVDSFPNASSAFAARLTAGGAIEVYAPYGFRDLFAVVARPNPGLAPRDVYETTTAGWRRRWPDLQVLPWPPDP